MTGIYFSGTGNSKFAAEYFVRFFSSENNAYSIEDKNALYAIENDNELVFAYPVQYSDIPKIVRDFITDNSSLWQNKRIFVIATMALFSGDGAGVLSRMLSDFGAHITGGLHLKMPDSICDEKVLKSKDGGEAVIIENAVKKLDKAVNAYKQGTPPKEGLSIFNRAAGAAGQRILFGHRTKSWSDKLKIDADKCIGCKKCIRLCPLDNISVKDAKAVPADRCTVCYRCVNSCPVQAITLLGKKVIKQYRFEMYKEE